MEFIREWGAHIMSAIGILGGTYAYFRHDRKLKAQEKQLNELQIRQLKKSEEKELQANIKCRASHGNKGSETIDIVNAGPADASNIRVEIIDKDNLNGIIFHDNWGPYELINANSSVEERITLCMGHTQYLKLKVVWDDEFAKDREAIINLQL